MPHVDAMGSLTTPCDRLQPTHSRFAGIPNENIGYNRSLRAAWLYATNTRTYNAKVYNC